MAAMLVHLAGPGDTAQEDFLMALCRELAARGVRVAVARPEEATAPPPVCGVAELRLGAHSLTLQSPGGAPSLEDGLRLLNGAELLLSLLPPVEGKAMVEFCGVGNAPGLLGRAGLLALAGPGDIPSDPGVPVFTDAAGLADFFAARLRERTERRALTILADGEPIKAKAFVKDIIANSLHGLLAPLKGTEGARRLEIIIEE